MKNFSETKRLLETSDFFYVITVNMEGMYNYVNPHYDQIFSKIHGSILNRPYEITMHPDDTKTCKLVAAKCFDNPDKVFPATIRKHDGKGGYIITQWEYKAMFDDMNIPAGIFCIGYDITQFIIQQTELSHAYTAIEKRNEVLKQIAFAQSHLIRMPLSNILGLADIILKSEMDDSIKNLVTMLNESAKQLDMRIREIVDNTNAV